MKKLTLILLIALGMVILATGIAMAAGAVIPHGGYDTSTDACLQCHDVHESAGDYVLLRWNTVTNTCGSCHYLFQTLPSAAGGSFGQGTFNTGTTTATVPLPGNRVAYDPGYSGDETRPVSPAITNADLSVGSRISAYEVAAGDALTAEGHNLSRGLGSFLFKDGKVANANYIPGGFYSLTAIDRANYPTTVPTLSYAATAGLYCASCHTPHGNFGKQLVNSVGTPVSTKILSGQPNHTAPSLSINNWGNEGGKWCTRCHGKRVPEAVDPVDGTIYHNHPDTFCLQCHGNYVGANVALQGSTDFPHTSKAANLLTNEPDALCITCHVPGSLP